MLWTLSIRLDTFGSHPKKIRVKESWNGGFVLHPLGRIPNRPSGFKIFAHRQPTSSGGQLWRYFWLIRHFELLLDPRQPCTFHFLLFLFLFPFPLFSFPFPHSAACWKWLFEALQVSGTDLLKLGSCPDRPRALPTSAGSCVPRFLLNWRANFYIFKVVSSSPHLFLVKVGMIYT